MGRRLPEVGRPGQDVSILAGDDVDPATGRLLTVAELQQALQAALAVHAQRPRHPVTGVDTPPALLASGEDLAAAAPPVDDEALPAPSGPRWMRVLFIDCMTEARGACFEITPTMPHIVYCLSVGHR